MVRLEFSIGLEYEVIQPTDFVFKIFAADTPCQKVFNQHLSVIPEIPYTIEPQEGSGNDCLRMRSDGGLLKVDYAASVDLSHQLRDPAELKEMPVGALPVDVLHFVHPSHYCP